MKTFHKHDGNKRVVQDTDGNDWYVHGIIYPHESGMEAGMCQINICPADGRPVRPERGVRLTQWLAHAWVEGKQRVHVS